MKKQKELWESLAKKNSRYYIAAFKGRKITEEEFRKSGKDDYLRLLTINGKRESVKGTFLEIGCGTGRMTEFIAEDWSKVIAIDISSEMIKQGKERLKKVKNIEWIETDGEILPLEDASVDFAFSYLVFQHVKTMRMIKRNFKEIYRVLKPGSLFLVFLRHKKEPMEWWSGGIAFNKTNLPDILDGFRVVKSDYREDCYTFWLWLQKV